MCVFVCVRAPDANLKSNTCWSPQLLGSLRAPGTSRIQAVMGWCWQTSWTRNVRVRTSGLFTWPFNFPHLSIEDFGHVIPKLDGFPDPNFSLWVSAHTLLFPQFVCLLFVPSLWSVNSYSSFTCWLESFFFRKVLFSHKALDFLFMAFSTAVWNLPFTDVYGLSKAHLSPLGCNF